MPDLDLELADAVSQRGVITQISVASIRNVPLRLLTSQPQLHYRALEAIGRLNAAGAKEVSAGVIESTALASLDAVPDTNGFAASRRKLRLTAEISAEALEASANEAIAAAEAEVASRATVRSLLRLKP